MNKRDIVIGLIVLALLAAVFFWLKKPSPELSVPEKTKEVSTIEKSFNITLPEDVEKAYLADITGGTAMGIATRRLVNGVFEHTVLSDLTEPRQGTFYEGWLVRGKPGSPDFDFISTGRMILGKGGYMLSFESTTDYSDHKGVVITIEEKEDEVPEEHILEGSF